jgi:hypothetical protein
MTQETRSFWTEIRDFFRMEDVRALESEVVLSQFKLIAQGERNIGTKLLSLAVYLPLFAGDAMWRRVGEFITQAERAELHPNYTLRQLQLVADGERGAKLHDMCGTLPLY